MTATILGIGLFFVAYFWVMRHPRFEPSIVPASWLDHAIGFEPAALPVYFSLWLYVSLAPALLKDLRELARFGIASVFLSLSGLAIFMLWPTKVPEFGDDWTQHPSIRFLKTVDVAGNACPSMHVAFAVFAAIWLRSVLIQIGAPATLRWLNGLWCLGIVWSTIATRQHVVYDVCAGAALGIVFTLPQWRALWLPAESHIGR
ncbi:MAG: phosphatase PAP2 family protein [Ideonella sp.]